MITSTQYFATLGSFFGDIFNFLMIATPIVMIIGYAIMMIIFPILVLKRLKSIVLLLEDLSFNNKNTTDL